MSQDAKLRGPLADLTVVDLSSGTAGPIASMLMADQGASVTAIERTEPILPGARVWARGKRRAALDPADESDARRVRALITQADVLIESFSPHEREKLGLDVSTVAGLNPRIVHCSITGYGPTDPTAAGDLPDAIVAARTGQHWESRGVPGGSLARLAGRPIPVPDLDVPSGAGYGPEREGPLHSAVPWASLAAAYQATLAISAALWHRERTGTGQHVATSLLQGALATASYAWQRAEHPEAEHFLSWVVDSRVPKGVYATKGGRWVHQWPMMPLFVLGVSEGDRLEVTAEAVEGAATRVALDPEEMVILHFYRSQLAERFARFGAEEWEQLFAASGQPLQPIRTPIEALDDEHFLADGCVVELDDPDYGPVRQAGLAYQLHDCPSTPRPSVRWGADTETVRAEADVLLASGIRPEPVPLTTPGAPPLAGITVVDLGLAVAGPFGTQLLADLGADVIKVNATRDDYWHRSHLAAGCNRGKRSITLDLKTPEGQAALRRLVARADVVQHNMRYSAAQRLGVDYETLRAVNPDLVYCHTRGHERGPREGLPGNDQTAAALTGVEWLEGGTARGGEPIWPAIALGDTGNGFLSAIAIVQALRHRERSGTGQFTETAIVNAHMLNVSAWAAVDGSATADLPLLDRELLGTEALRRLYRTADGWLCLAASDDQWSGLVAAVGGSLGKDDRFADSLARRQHDEALSAVLADVFASRSGAGLVADLESCGVTAALSDSDFVGRFFDDPENHARGWAASHRHRDLGRLDSIGALFDFSGHRLKMRGGPLIPGQDTAEILSELGYSDQEVDALLANGVAVDVSVPELR